MEALKAEQAETVADAILGMDIKGHTVRTVLITPAVDIASEYYIGMLIDRNSKRVLLMASAEGGSSQPQASKANEATWVRQLLDVLSMPVNQKVQSSVGSTAIML